MIIEAPDAAGVLIREVGRDPAAAAGSGPGDEEVIPIGEPDDDDGYRGDDDEDDEDDEGPDDDD